MRALKWMHLNLQRVVRKAMSSTSELGIGRNDTATIQRDGRAVHIRTGATAQEETGAGDILRTADPAERDVRLDAVLEALERGLHHLGLKWPARNDVGSAEHNSRQYIVHSASWAIAAPSARTITASQVCTTHVMPRLPR